MKKLVAVGALAVLLAGCADDSADEPAVPEEDSTSSLEQNTVNTPPEDNSEAEEQASEEDTDSEEPTSEENSDATESNEEDASSNDSANSELASFEEYSKIEEVADVSNLKGIVETDNPGTRVILFEEDNGNKTLKSVFVKKENRLKVISLDDDGLLYNDILK